MAQANDDLSRLSGELYRHWERSMSQWWDGLLDSPAFLQQLGDGLAAHSKMRAEWEDHVDTTMTNLNLPSRRDITRLARIASLLEDRLLSMEDRLLEMDDRLQGMEREVLQARVDAAEARIELRERLEAIEKRLPAPRKPRTRRAPKPKEG